MSFDRKPHHDTGDAGWARVTWPAISDALPSGHGWALSVGVRCSCSGARGSGREATANALPWSLALVRPMSANRPLTAEGRTARASGGSETGGSARNDRRSPADERPALAVVPRAIATLQSNQ